MVKSPFNHTIFSIPEFIYWFSSGLVSQGNIMRISCAKWMGNYAISHSISRVTHELWLTTTVHHTPEFCFPEEQLHLRIKRATQLLEESSTTLLSKWMTTICTCLCSEHVLDSNCYCTYRLVIFASLVRPNEFPWNYRFQMVRLKLFSDELKCKQNISYTTIFHSKIFETVKCLAQHRMRLSTFLGARLSHQISIITVWRNRLVNGL